MESKTNYTVIGIIVLFLAAALLSSLLWLSVGFERVSYKNYTVYITESVHGLIEDSLVKFNGVKVGVVSHIELDKTDPQRIKLLLNINQDVPITISTRASLVTQGITGTTFLGLTATTASLTPLEKTGNEPYPVIPYTDSFLNRVEENLTVISNNLKLIIDPENARLLKDSLKNIKDISQTISKNNEYINQSLKEIPRVISELKTSARDVSSMAMSITSASGQFSKTMQAGRASIDQINQQTLPSTTTLLQRIDNIAANLEQVSSLMRENPAVLIRGSTPQPSGPGE